MQSTSKRYKRIKFLLIAPVCFLASCAIVILGQWFYADWAADRSVLTDLPCAPPCWYGIVPGEKISEAEVQRRVRAMPNYDGDWKPIEITVAWFWKQRPWLGTGSNSITNRTDGVVDIGLWYDFDLTAQQIVEKYGIPTAVNYGPSPLPEHPYVRFNIYYPLRGLMFVARVEPWHAPLLSRDTWVAEGIYVKPAESLDQWRQQSSGIELQPWPGYGNLATARP